ncbi:hypothetical protein BV20DRAFT_960338 [Pilatotrama ljubarskyi]|nr:hypothetical protein BV20DRAFT_960338 [Pilatotrama ljubarskyi]
MRLYTHPGVRFGLYAGWMTACFLKSTARMCIAYVACAGRAANLGPSSSRCSLSRFRFIESCSERRLLNDSPASIGLSITDHAVIRGMLYDKVDNDHVYLSAAW